MVYTFNELSLMHKVTSLEAIYTILEGFVKSCIRAKELGLDDLRLYEENLSDLYSIPLHQDYNVDAWLNDNRVNEDLRIRFREIVVSSPLIRDFEIDQNELYKRSEFRKRLNERTYQVWGLGAAHILDTLSISLATHPDWKGSEIEIIHYYLNEILEEETKDVIVKHFSSCDHLDNHIAWLEKYQANSLIKSAELWSRRKEFFPNLEFCEGVESQLKTLGISKTLYQIIDRLRTLDNYVKNWSDGGFNYKDVNQRTNLRVSPESIQTLKKFGTLRKFQIPEQGKKIFDLHIKTGHLRFHFYTDDIDKKVYIGYIGKHLRIASEA